MSDKYLVELPVDTKQDDLRKIRLAGDIELCRCSPAWFSVMFHYGRFLSRENRWVLFYSVQMTKEDEPRLFRLEIGRIMLADGSTVWGRVIG